MNRTLTNIIRFILDQLIPPILRDNKTLMYPAFFIWCGGRHSAIKGLMEYKATAFDKASNPRQKDTTVPTFERIIDTKHLK